MQYGDDKAHFASGFGYPDIMFICPNNTFLWLIAHRERFFFYIVKMHYYTNPSMVQAVPLP